MPGLYNDLVMDHFLHPRRVGELAEANAVHTAENPACGDTLQLQLRIEGGRISDARFRALGCTAAIATSSFLADWVVGKSMEEAQALTNEALAAAMGGLPRGRVHCSVLAEEALAGCLKDYASRPRDPSSGRP